MKAPGAALLCALIIALFLTGRAQGKLPPLQEEDNEALFGAPGSRTLPGRLTPRKCNPFFVKEVEEIRTVFLRWWGGRVNLPFPAAMKSRSSSIAYGDLPAIFLSSKICGSL